jgi:hypothetical protein
MMNSEATTLDTPFREWRPTEWFDRGFLQQVPLKDRSEFLRAFRPLPDGASAEVQGSLFAGIKKPFHYQKATGWIKQLYQKGIFDSQISTYDEATSAIREKTRWPDEALVLLVYHQPSVYVTTWGNFLRYFQKDCVNLDTVLVCHPTQRDVLLFWEDSCIPILGKRGRRDLPCPDWDGQQPPKGQQHKEPPT